MISWMILPILMYYQSFYNQEKHTSSSEMHMIALQFSDTNLDCKNFYPIKSNMMWVIVGTTTLMSVKYEKRRYPFMQKISK